MPLDPGRDQAVSLGRDRFVVHAREGDGSLAVEHLLDGQPWHGYRVRPVPREIAYFREVIADSFRPEATFMNAVVLVRFSGGRSRAIRNLSLAESWGDDEVRRPIAGPDALIELAVRLFGAPREVATAALEVVREKLATAPP